MQPIVSRKQKWTGKLSPETYFSTSNMGTFKTNYIMCLEYRKFALARLPSEVRNGTVQGVAESGYRTVTHMAMSVPSPKKKSTVKRIFFGSEYLSKETI